MTLSTALESAGGLLDRDEPLPVDVFNESAAAPLLVVCDHAGRRVPRRLGNLGLDAAAFDRHIAWDIGAAEVARRLALRLDAPLVLSVYSRLVIDMNRRPDDPTSIPEESDGTAVPGNRGLDAPARALRVTALHEPYHAAIAARLSDLRARGPAPVVLSIHSFTPVFKGYERPWHIGILWNRDARLAAPLMTRLRTEGVTVGDNQPYSGQDRHGYTMPRHAEAAGLAHVLIEIRQDLIDTRQGADTWSATLYDVLVPLLAEPALRVPFSG
jgi:predicted N-formylglutamate amidohydrolase